MLWCLTGGALILALLSLVALMAHLPRLPHLRPWLLVRGCAALTLLAGAAGLLGLALLLTR